MSWHFWGHWDKTIFAHVRGELNYKFPARLVMFGPTVIDLWADFCPVHAHNWSPIDRLKKSGST